jgi:hypothetical protein
MPGSENATAMLVRLEQYLDTFDWSGLTRGKQVILESCFVVTTKNRNSQI